MQHPLINHFLEQSALRRMPPRGARRVLALKRAREASDRNDGVRVLVDRLWPRGLTREQLAADLWLRDVAPSTALRRWYGHDPLRWDAFVRKYRAQLARRADLLNLLDELRRRDRLTLVYDASDTARNNAVVLRDVLIARRFATPRSNWS